MSDLSNFSMLDLFRSEMENHLRTLNQGLLQAENDPDSKQILESLMRAAHSIKGAARIVQIDPVVKVAHAMEDRFVAALNGKQPLNPENNDVLLKAIDFLGRVATVAEPDLPAWQMEHAPEAETLVAIIASLRKTESSKVPLQETQKSTAAEDDRRPKAAAPEATTSSLDSRSVRVDSDNLNRLVGFAGESLVSASWLGPFADRLRQLKHLPLDLSGMLDKLQQMTEEAGDSRAFPLTEIRAKVQELRELIDHRFNELENFSRRELNLSNRLYREALASRMRPFADGVEGFPRMVRDVARQLGKKVKFEMKGKATRVDRDILEKLEAPLTHLLRNAVDHGIEFPEERVAAGKPVEGVLRMEAHHRGGMLFVSVIDDGRGIHYRRLRENILSKKMATETMLEKMTHRELIEFLFLPGFSTADKITEISGRGFGLDVVATMVREVGGSLKADSEEGRGLSFELQLPLTLSVIKTLLVTISGEPYAIPLSRIDRTASVERSIIKRSGPLPYFEIDGVPLYLIDAAAVLELPGKLDASDHNLSVVILSEASSRFGLIVDGFIGQIQIAVRPLDPRLGKVQDVNSVALLEDGSPAFVLDVPELIYSISNYVNRLRRTGSEARNGVTEQKRKRILIVDDSITVREVERKILETGGYDVETAVDGLEGIIALRTARLPFDLLISDVDMPRMSGVDLVARLKDDAKLRHIPVIMISYKDREEDRQKGLQAGADCYLTKSDFSEELLLQAVKDLLSQGT